ACRRGLAHDLDVVGGPGALEVAVAGELHRPGAGLEGPHLGGEASVTLGLERADVLPLGRALRLEVDADVLVAEPAPVVPVVSVGVALAAADDADPAVQAPVEPAAVAPCDLK